MKTHILKTWPEYFREVAAWRKTFEVRRNDRDYRVGDSLILREWDPDAGMYSGRELAFRVAYMTDFGQAPGNVVMALEQEPKPIDIDACAKAAMSTPASSSGGHPVTNEDWRAVARAVLRAAGVEGVE